MKRKQANNKQRVVNEHPRYANKQFELDAASISAGIGFFTGQPRALAAAFLALCGRKARVTVPGELIEGYLLEHRDEIPEIRKSVYYEDPLRIVSIYGGSLQRHGMYREV